MLINKSLTVDFWITVFVINEMISITSAQKCQCGQIRVNPRVKRVHRGINVPEGSVPWQMYLRILSFRASGGIEKRDYGGVLISKKHIVTCAGCMKDFFEQ